MNPFKLACFTVLMSRKDIPPHPDYLQEKFDSMWGACNAYCYNMLDFENQLKVNEWCKQWNLDLGKLLKQQR